MIYSLFLEQQKTQNTWHFVSFSYYKLLIKTNNAFMGYERFD